MNTFNSQMPSTAENWKKVARSYERQWNFPHCIGAVDGKHCVIQAPINCGSEYFNYKSHFSIVLMGIADADYQFLFADVGCQGRISDGGVFNNTLICRKLRNNELDLPREEALPNREMKVPYVFVGDDAFGLQENLMKAYPVEQKKGSKKRIFNYRLCRARRIIENVFGIMSSVFRVLRKPMLLCPEKATKVVMACIHLHNFLRQSRISRQLYMPCGSLDHYADGELVEGTWRKDNEELKSFFPLKKTPRKPAEKCESIRNEFAEYFVSEKGRVEWQDKYA